MCFDFAKGTVKRMWLARAKCKLADQGHSDEKWSYLMNYAKSILSDIKKDVAKAAGEGKGHVLVFLDRPGEKHDCVFDEALAYVLCGIFGVRGLLARPMLVKMSQHDDKGSFAVVFAWDLDWRRALATDLIKDKLHAAYLP